MKESLTQLFEKDLWRVIEEIESYESEAHIWKVEGEIANSAGNLTLHVIGNIKHFFGANLGNTGYIRDRDREFADKNVPRVELVKGLKETIEVLKDALNGLSDEDFQKEYSEEIFGGGHTTDEITTYMLIHLNYHLGQINYHRRLLGK